MSSSSTRIKREVKEEKIDEESEQEPCVEQEIELPLQKSSNQGESNQERSSPGKKAKQNVFATNKKPKTKNCSIKRKTGIIKENCNRHKCNECNYSFAHKCLLKRHMNRHTGKKPFKCDQCDKFFARKYYFS